MNSAEIANRPAIEPEILAGHIERPEPEGRMAEILASPSASSPPAGTTPPDHPPWAMPLAVYERIVEAGLLGDFPRVYLWDGRLCDRMGIDRPHGLGVKNVFLALIGLRLAGYDAETEMPMALRTADSAPQPDVKVVRGRSKDYNPHMPTTADVPLVVEVSDSTLAKDRGMATTYAIEGIPVYWLLNLNARRLEAFSEPSEGVYTRCTPFGPDDEAPVVLDGREVGRVRVADLLP